MKKLKSLNWDKSIILKYRFGIIVTVMFIISMVIKLSVMFSCPYAFGADGYYYAAQINSFWKKGRFFSPDSSIVLYFLSFFSLLGKNIIVTNKIAVSIISSALVFPSFSLGKKLSSPLTGITLAAIIVSSSMSSYFCIDYIKNLGGIFFFLLFLNILADMVCNGVRLKNSLLLITSFVLVFFSHKLMAGITIILTCVFILWRYKKSWKAVFVIGVLTVAALSVIIIMFPNTLSFHDFERFLSSDIFSFQLPPLSYILKRKTAYIFYPEIIIFALSPVLYFLIRKRLDEKLRIFLLFNFLLFIISNNPFLSFKGNDLAFRFYILTFIPSSIFISIFLDKFNNMKIFAMGIVFLMCYQYFIFNFSSKHTSFHYEIYDTILPMIDIPKNSLLIVHQGFDYFYCYNNRGDSFHFLPEEKHRGRPIYRLAHGVPYPEFKEILKSDNRFKPLHGFYTLLKEKDWKYFLSNIPEKKRKAYLNWKNPHIYRPSYMKRNDMFIKD